MLNTEEHPSVLGKILAFFLELIRTWRTVRHLQRWKSRDSCRGDTNTTEHTCDQLQLLLISQYLKPHFGNQALTMPYNVFLPQESKKNPKKSLHCNWSSLMSIKVKNKRSIVQQKVLLKIHYSIPEITIYIRIRIITITIIQQLTEGLDAMTFVKLQSVLPVR